jgi:receptor-type tyrosine-protein phosphatase beta
LVVRLDEILAQDFVFRLQGHNSPREFIVTQGPLHSTRDDFWRMAWESNSRAIVMLTRCFEKGREKCDHYWPHDTVPVYYGDIKVTLLNDSHYPDWVITEFMMQRVSVCMAFGS